MTPLTAIRMVTAAYVHQRPDCRPTARFDPWALAGSFFTCSGSIELSGTTPAAESWRGLAILTAVGIISPLSDEPRLCQSAWSLPITLARFQPAWQPPPRR